MNVSKMLSRNILPWRPGTKSSSGLQLCGLHIDVKTFPLVLVLSLVQICVYLNFRSITPIYGSCLKILYGNRYGINGGHFFM